MLYKVFIQLFTNNFALKYFISPLCRSLAWGVQLYICSCFENIKYDILLLIRAFFILAFIFNCLVLVRQCLM